MGTRANPKARNSCRGSEPLLTLVFERRIRRTKGRSRSGSTLSQLA